MTCAWKQLLAILPPELGREVDSLGRETAQEIRLRRGSPPELVTGEGSRLLSGMVTAQDLRFILNTASRYSPWSATTMAQGYVTAPGGHRIGLCGTAICRDGTFQGIQEIRSVCIRVARDYPGIAGKAAQVRGSVLILGAPGWGKTTLLRDLIRLRARQEAVSVVDERGELFPEGFDQGRRMDILSGCPKATGVEIVLRTMGPNCIAVDEITAERDCDALVQASNCGVWLLATAHAASGSDYRSRTVYHRLVEHRIFNTLLVLHADKTYHVERMI